MPIVNHAKHSAFSKKVGYIAYFGVNHQNMELVGDQVGFQLKEQVRALLKAHQCSILNMVQNPSIYELSPWLNMFHWHELAINHIIPIGNHWTILS